MESVGSSKEEVKWNTPVPAPHIIPYSYFPSHFLAQISNTSAKIILVSENDGIESNNDDETEILQWDEVGKYPPSNVCGIIYSLTLKSLY